MSVKMSFEQKHSSAAGVLAHLQENERDLQIYALKKLDLIVHNAWHEISEHLSKMYSILSAN